MGDGHEHEYYGCFRVDLLDKRREAAVMINDEWYVIS